MHPVNSMITLTYDDQNVPTNYSVEKPALQKFFKRLRKSLRGKKIKYFACGEYGEKTLRPHYHAIIFNHDFPDKRLHAERRGHRYYKSDALQRLWPFGELNEITDCNWTTARYVAGYIHKKIGGDAADDHYTRVSPIDGQIYRVQPEFLLPSLSLGNTWFQKFKSDAFPSDFVIVDGRKKKPPRFYTDKLKEDQRDRLLAEHEEKETIKRARRAQALTQKANNTKDRLAVREELATIKLNNRKREL